MRPRGRSKLGYGHHQKRYEEELADGRETLLTTMTGELQYPYTDVEEPSR